MALHGIGDSVPSHLPGRRCVWCDKVFQKTSTLKCNHVVCDNCAKLLCMEYPCPKCRRWTYPQLSVYGKFQNMRHHYDEIGPNRSTFDFWDDVVKPAWHDIVGRKFTASSFTYLCSQFNLDFRDALRNDTLKIEMHRLKSEVVCPEADAPFVICCMMHFFRSAEGVECFLDALKSASELNAGVWTILLSIWKQHGRNQSLRCVCSKVWLQGVVEKNLRSIASQLATIPDDVLINLLSDTSMNGRFYLGTDRTDDKLWNFPDLSAAQHSFLSSSLDSAVGSYRLLSILRSDQCRHYFMDKSLSIDDMLKDAGIGVKSLLQVQADLASRLTDEKPVNDLTAASGESQLELTALKNGNGSTLTRPLGTLAVLVPYGRLIMCGSGRTGKSSLLRSLLGQMFQSESDSTIGVELEKVMCMIEQSGDIYEWKPVKSEYAHQLALTRKAIDKAAQKMQIKMPIGHETLGTQPTAVHPEQEDSEPSRDALPVSEESEPDDALYTAASHLASETEGPAPASLSSALSSPNRQHSVSSLSPSISKELVSVTEKINRFLLELRSGKGFTRDQLAQLVFLDAWDFAGQRVFAAIQHMVLACSRCAYAVLFNASQKLQDVAKPTLVDGGKEYILKNEPDLTNFGILETWLNTIHEVVGNNAEVPIFVVGTHIDKVSKSRRESVMKEHTEYIFDNSNGKVYANDIDEIVYVDNTRAGSSKEDPAIVDLRKQIIDKLQVQFRVAIPVRWLPFTVATSHIAQEFGRKWVSLDELRHIAEASGSISDTSDKQEFQELVRFHHDLGHILHFNNNPRLQDKVIIDVHWLLKVLSLLFSPQPKYVKDKKYRLQYDQLTKYGILLETLALRRWSNLNEETRNYTSTEEQRKFLFDIGEHFALFHDTKAKAQVPGEIDGITTRKFFVPALVRRVTRLQNEMRHGFSTPSMYLYSGSDSYFPQTLFWCGVVRCMQEYSHLEDPILHHSSARILCRDEFWLVMNYFQHGIQLNMEVPGCSNKRKGENDKRRLSAVEKARLVWLCHEVLRYLKSELDELKQFSLKHVSISRAVCCMCENHRNKCRRHGVHSCPDLDCQHYALVTKERRTRCQQDGRPEVDITDVREYWPCFYDDQPPPLPVDPEVETRADGYSRLTSNRGSDGTAGTGSLRTVTYRSAITRHHALLTSCSTVDFSRSTKLLKASEFLNAPTVDSLETWASQSPAEAWMMLVAHLPDAALCHFVDEVLPEIGLREISTTLKRCPGEPTCSLQVDEHHTEGEAVPTAGWAATGANIEPRKDSEKTARGHLKRGEEPEKRSDSSEVTDPWKCKDYRGHHGWLLGLDPTMFRNKGFQSGLINHGEKDVLMGTDAQRHNELLLSYANSGGVKSFRQLLDTLAQMGERYDEKRRQLEKLIPATTKGIAPALDYRSALKKHSEALRTCTELDPVSCSNKLVQLGHMSQKAHKAVKSKCSGGRYPGLEELRKHVLQLSTSGQIYFVDHCLRAKYPDLADTIQNCPGESLCKLGEMDMHCPTSKNGVTPQPFAQPVGDTVEPRASSSGHLGQEDCTADASAVTDLLAGGEDAATCAGVSSGNPVDTSNVASEFLPSSCKKTTNNSYADTSVPLRRTLSSPANAAAVGGEKVPALRPNFSSSVSEPSASSLSSPSSSQASGPYSGSAASLTASSSISTAKDSADCDLDDQYCDALRKHAIYFRSCHHLDAEECMLNLYTEGHADGDDVTNMEKTASDQKGAISAVKLLYTKLRKGSKEGLRYFVDNVLPELENAETLLHTLKVCPGPGKCPLKPSQHH